MDDFEYRYLKTTAPEPRWLQHWVRRGLCAIGWHEWTWKMLPGEPISLSASPPSRAKCRHCAKSFALGESVGLDDIHGTPVREGDEVLLYAQNYSSTLIEGGLVPIYEEDHTKPHLVADVPLVRGTVVWSFDMLCWGVRVSWTTPDWDNPPCWIHLGGGSYAVEVAPTFD